MKTINWMVWACVLLTNLTGTSGAQNTLYEASSVVIEHGVREKDFEKIDAPRVVQFYSPLCPHCVRFKPAYMKTAHETHTEYPQVDFYAVSCVTHNDLCRKYKVMGTPSIFTFKNLADKDGVRMSDREFTKELVIKNLGLTAPAQPARKLELSNGDEDEDADEDADNSPTGDDGGDADDVDMEDEDEDQQDGTTDTEPQSGNEDEDQEDKQFPPEQPSEQDPDGAEETADKSPEQEEEEEEEEEETEEEEEQEEEETEEEEEETEEEEGETEEEEAEEDDIDDEDENGEIASPDRQGFPPKGPTPKGSPPKGPTPKGLTPKGPPPKGSFMAPKGFGPPQGQLGPRAGADKGRHGPRDMDRWKDLLAKEKEKLDKAQKRKLPFGKKFSRKDYQEKQKFVAKQAPKMNSQTIAMKANTPGTPEFEARRKNIMKQIEQRKTKPIRERTFDRKEPVQDTRKMPFKKEEMPIKKEIKKPTLAQKLPVVKRLYKMHPEEELILDASLSFVTSLKYGVFTDEDPLNAKKKDALKSWLEFMSVSLPPEWSLHELIDDLHSNIDYVSMKRANLEKLINKYSLPRKEWSKSCVGASLNGFSCGFWKLMHIATIGVAEHRGGLNLVESEFVKPSTRTFSPMEAADTIREYIAHFFTCRECQKKFIAQYDDCSFRRCDRLTDDKEDASAGDWQELAKWLWEVHNDVSVRVRNQRAKRQTDSFPATKEQLLDEVRALYPTIESCLACFKEDGSWDEDAVFLYLEHTYWPGTDFDPKVERFLRYERQRSSGSGFVWFLVFVALGMLYSIRGRMTGANLRLVTAAGQSMVATSMNKAMGGKMHAT